MPQMLYSGGAQVFCPSVLCALHFIYSSTSWLMNSQFMTIYFMLCIGYFALLIFWHIPPATAIMWRMGCGIMFLGLLGKYLTNVYWGEGWIILSSFFFIGSPRRLRHFNFADLFKWQSRWLPNAFMTFRNWDSFAFAIYRMNSFNYVWFHRVCIWCVFLPHDF